VKRASFSAARSAGVRAHAEGLAAAIEARDDDRNADACSSLPFRRELIAMRVERVRLRVHLELHDKPRRVDAHMLARSRDPSVSRTFHT
jgi:hypothetical protein